MPPSFANTLQVNSYDLHNLGFALNVPGGVRDLAGGREYPAVEAPGRDGLVLSSTLPKVGARELVLPGHVVADTHATLLTYLDALKYRLSLGLLDVRLADDTTKRIFARLSRFTSLPAPRELARRIAEIEIRLLAHDPYWYTVALDSTAFTTSNTAMALGTAPTRPTMIRITGICVNPIVIYKNSAGIEIRRMGFTYSQPGATDKIEIDCINQTITKTVSGTPSNAASLLTSGDFITLDPQHGDYPNSAWPTLNLSVSSGTPTCLCEYYRAWQ